MTIASCFACGEFKVGAFTPCPACGNAPATLEQEAQSLALTDHYLAPEELEHVRQQAAVGQPIHIDPVFYEQLLQTLRDERTARANRPWWKFW
ncbi:hypothetical protein MUN82_04940 [Hymenobacter aerilatus]|uniref:Uncharacterized protein n=1 Tax=Hymenobacter aerilatus TaxID=2932251 RepID=A0A8T9SW55_9BACT|nr:hypothetical protein [Hymenobacter aerilatus]UOR06442.1 hypothetical protein MUN82_04940 [Hymenobacter aerilatus]